MLIYILHCSHYILSIFHRICCFQHFFPTEEFWGNRMKLSWNAHLLGSQVCIIYLPPTNHKLSEAFFSDKEDTLNEVSSGSGEAWLKSISSNSGGKSDSSAWVRKINFLELVCGQIFSNFMLIVVILSHWFILTDLKKAAFCFQDHIQYLT